MKALYLTGFMGAGKTTIGRVLGETLGIPVIDTDEQIEKEAGKTIRDIFAEEGEEAFRQKETAILRALPTECVIITTGGGIVTKEENRTWMKEHGTVVYLYCDPNNIVQRLNHDTTRPLFQHTDLTAFFDLFHLRQPLYEQAAWKIDTTNRDVADIVEQIASLIK